MRDRLVAIVVGLEARVARVEARVDEARERGIDTSRPEGVSATSADHALGSLRARLDIARRELARWDETHPV